jgi:serine/threonine-protein kinase
MTEILERLAAALAERYTIERELGEGGMATVYLAEDLKHDRKVALKVLKPELAAVLGADRFVQEIKTTASLQHPHILPLFDSGEAGGFLYYVMPYIEGETLRDKLDRETQLGVDDAVRIVSEVADALDYAHRNDVIHRDIKPENILLHDGRPMVADFGIALAVSAAAGGRMTETGLSLGTPHYMSPEQATAEKEITNRSDIYSLGCVLYEMLTGDPPHTGSTAQQIIMKIVTEDAQPITKLRRSVPPNVTAAVAKAVEKLPADRFVEARDFAQALTDPAFRHGEESAAAVGAGGAGPWKRVAIATWALFLIFAVVVGWALRRPEPVRHVQRFSDPFEDGQVPTYLGGAGFGISSDGTALAYRHRLDANQILMVRRWDEVEATPVRGTLDAASPAFSPDGVELAFDQDGEVKALSLAGGPVRTLTRGDAPFWGPDGYIYAEGDSGAVRVPASGGAVEALTRAGEGEEHQVTDILPGGRFALLEVDFPGPGEHEIRVVNLGSGEMTPLTFGEEPRFVPSGHLLYLVDSDVGSTLMAVRFDPGKLELLAAPVPILEDLIHYAVSDDGTLFYSASAADAFAPDQVVWVTRTGEATPVDSSWVLDGSGYRGVDLSLSPDGRRLAVREETQFGDDIWIKQLDAGPRSRFTFVEAVDQEPVWTPDGRNVTFVSDRAGDRDVWTKAADGTGEAQLLVDLDEPIFGAVWSADGEWLVLRVVTATGRGDILAIRPGVDSVPRPLVATPAREESPALSPDGRWLAYQSDETGAWEVYVRPFPDVNGGLWQVSVAGGRGPKWSHDGSELFFTNANDEFVAVDVETASGFRTDRPRSLFAIPVEFRDGRNSGLYFDVAPGDDRFIVLRRVDVAGSTGARTFLVNNFFEELKRRVQN